jgi:hypothetical protein
LTALLSGIPIIITENREHIIISQLLGFMSFNIDNGHVHDKVPRILKNAVVDITL